MTVLNNYKAKFKAAGREYLNTHSFYLVDEFGVCKYDVLYGFDKMFVVFCAVNLYGCVYDFFHILLS
jgi:hypothetical protein